MQYIVFFLCVIALIILAKIFFFPLKKILKLIINIFFGIFLIIITNIFGEKIGLHIPFNIVTAIVAGFLGTPGVVSLIILNYIF